MVIFVFKVYIVFFNVCVCVGGGSVAWGFSPLNENEFVSHWVGGMGGDDILIN